MESRRETPEHWRQHVEAFSYSGLTRNAYCQKNGIRVYQLDYWRKKFKNSNPSAIANDRKEWVPLQICEERPANKSTGIQLRIDRFTVEIEPGFNPELLSQVLRIVGSAC